MNKINKEKLNNSSFDQSEEIITLMDIILVLASQIRVILITPTILCVFAIIYVLLFLKPTFTSTAKIMSSSTGGNVSQAAGIAAQFGINLPTGQSETKWVYPEIIKSRTLARSMLRRKFDTDKFGDLGTETKRNIKDLKSVPNIDPDTKQGTMKTAVGTAIRGRAPSYYEALPKTDTRELPGPFEETVPDRRTATRAGFGAALQKSIEEEGISHCSLVIWYSLVLFKGLVPLAL